VIYFFPKRIYITSGVFSRLSFLVLLHTLYRTTRLTEAKQIIEAWRREYNESRPHRALGERTPNEFAGQLGASPDLTSMQAAGASP